MSDSFRYHPLELHLFPEQGSSTPIMPGETATSCCIQAENEWKGGHMCNAFFIHFHWSYGDSLRICHRCL